MPFKLFIRSINKLWISFFRTVTKKTAWKYKTMRLFLRIYQDSKMIGKRCYWAKNKHTPGEPVLPFLDLFLNPRGSLLYHRLCWRKPKKMRFVHISNSVKVRVFIILSFEVIWPRRPRRPQKGPREFFQKLHFRNQCVPTKKMRYVTAFSWKFSLNLSTEEVWSKD